jgi:hypothetical protein
MKDFFIKNKPYFLSAIGLIVIVSVYFAENLQGKKLQESDLVQYFNVASEITKYNEEGRSIKWTNSLFSGMPTYQVSNIGDYFPLKSFYYPRSPYPWSTVTIMAIGAFLLFIALGCNHWLAIIGGIALAFTSSNLIIIEAGHATKASVISYIPIVLAGLVYLYKKRWLLGINILTLSFAIAVWRNHYQIIYYLGFIVGVWILYEFVNHFKNKDLKGWFKATAIAGACMAAGIAANSLGILVTQEYVKDSIRGTSELTIAKDNSFTKPSAGLDIDYAFQWSNGWMDLVPMIIPNYAGGGSGTNLGSNSPLQGRINEQALKSFPFAYWGNLPFTSGPVYFGAAIFFLFLLGMFMAKGQLKWWLLGLSILSIMMSMGKNGFAGFNTFLFENLPMYNKFRAPTMALTIAQICVPIIGILGLRAWFTRDKKDEHSFKHLKYAGIGALAIVFIFTFMSDVFTDYTKQIVDKNTGEVLKDYDREVEENYGISVDILQEIRADLIQKDGLRSMFFIAAVFVLLFFNYRGKIKNQTVMIAIASLVLIDLWGVGKRYLNNDNFKSITNASTVNKPTQADLEIMKDKSHYRVLDLRSSPMSGSTASKFHKSIGGYNAAKLRRYQEFFDWYISDDIQQGKVENSSYLNMLNTKYVLFADKESNTQYFKNNNAYGVAWFISEINPVATADEAIQKMADIDPSNTAILEGFSASNSKQFELDSNATISLKSYDPEHMVYEATTAKNAFVVFSEIYYNKGWNAYLNGEKVNHYRANFILRGMELPAGNHTIEFKFEPKTYALGKKIQLSANYVILAVFLLSLGLWIKNNFVTKS